MASVSKDSKGWRIRFYDADGSLRTIRPGKVNKATAEQIGRHVDSLAATVASQGVIARQTALWLAGIGDKLRAKLERARLVEPIEPVELEPVEIKPTLAAFLEDHVQHGRTSKGRRAADSTIAKWIGTQRFLVDVFGDQKRVDEVTREDAHQFRVWLDKRRIKQKTAGRKGQPMAENAKRKHIANCKMFFNAAVRRGLIAGNPFESQVSGTEANRSRDHYITPADTSKLLKAAPDTQWRLMIALWRLAGLRKMEIFELTWGDVLADQGKIRVRSEKTKHVDGCEMRYVPIRDVQQYLEDAFTEALEAGRKGLPPDTPIVTRFSKSNSNLDKPFKLIIEKAGLIPWPKLFQNLRSSCETQWLKEGARADLVANWIGHSVKVQRQNYVQQTDDDILAFNACKSGHTGGHEGVRTDQKSPEVAIQVAMPKPAKTLKPSKNAGETRCLTTPGGT